MYRCVLLKEESLRWEIVRGCVAPVVRYDGTPTRVDAGDSTAVIYLIWANCDALILKEMEIRKRPLSALFIRNFDKELLMRNLIR